MVGEEARVWSRGGLFLRELGFEVGLELELPSESAMVRIVERELLEDNGGDVIWGERPRRP